MLVLILLLLPIALFLIHHLLFKDRKLPPGPTLWQLWQKRSTFANKPHLALKELADIYCPLFSIRIGGHLAVVASSPSTAEEILRTNNRVFSARFIPSLYQNIPGTKDALLVMAGDCDASWKLLRNIFHNSFVTSKALESAATIRKAKVLEMLKLLQGKNVVDIEQLVNLTYTNIIMNILSSRDMYESGGVGAKDEGMMKLLEMCTDPGLVDLFPILRGVDFWNRGRSMEVYRRVKLIWGDIIKERREKCDDLDSERDFLDGLMGCSLDDDQLAMILLELLLAGTEATTVTTVWLMAELIKNQQVFLNVRREIELHAVEGGALNEPLLSTCSYFQACIEETLRLHVPAPFGLPHRATKNIEISNYMIPKDSIVLVNAWAIQLNSDIWKDASSFKPQRFLDSSIDYKGSHFEFIPFSSGTRMCPGWITAIKSLEFVVASFVYYFDWSLPNGENPSDLDMSDEFGISVKKEKPLNLMLDMVCIEDVEMSRTEARVRLYLRKTILLRYSAIGL